MQPAEAINEWETARAVDGSFALVHRNLGQAYARRENNVKKAIAEMETAFSLRPHPRWLYEIDELYEAAGVTPKGRLAYFQKHSEAVLQRDDVLAREIGVLVQDGQYDEALKLLAGRTFYIWEGAVANPHDSFVDAHLLRGHKLLKAAKPAEALKDYEAALEYPENLGIGKPYRGDRSAVIYYWIGAANEAAGNAAKAREFYRKSADEPTYEGRRRRVRLDAADLAFHQALALNKLGDKEKAAKVFEALVAEGHRRLAGGAAVQDFAKFGQRTLPNVENARAHYVIGLGYLGLGKTAEAKAEFGQAVKLDVNQMWAAYELSALK
jgi:tetratricopeptide (TPR) repeat protein